MSLSSDLHMCVLALLGEDIHTCTHREEVAGDLTNGGDRPPYPFAVLVSASQPQSARYKRFKPPNHPLF